ncbi:ABC transporter permease [Coprococcus comes]|nr:ABC transporter permease [Coprococcus comes]MDC0792215.1 ABC transporter permease [Coprococcus comes]
MLSEIALLSYSVCFMLLTAIASVFFGMLPGYITFEWNSISYLFKKCIEIAILTAFSILPLLAVAAAGKNYILPVCVTLVYTFLSFILLMVNMYLHPLSSATAIIMRDIPGVILAQEVNIPAALFCIGIWTIVSIVFAYISLKHRK